LLSGIERKSINDDLQSSSVKLTEEYLGDLTGKLYSIRSWVDDIENNDVIVTVLARIPINTIKYFKDWLKQVTNSRGTVEENARQLL